jgi:hypothetical protein
VVFVLAPVMLLTGAAMSPAIAASFPWYIKLLGGRQVARSIHFLGMLAFTVFFVFHVILVLVVHPRENLTNITLGGQPQRLGLALAIAVPALVLVVALNVWATWFSLRNRRAVQVALDTFEAPTRKLALHNLAPGQNYNEPDISPYHWVNGAPPKPAESPEYHRLLEGGWRNWRLEVGGLVGEPLSLSLDELKAMPSQVQITKHNCVQGWCVDRADHRLPHRRRGTGRLPRGRAVLRPRRRDLAGDHLRAVTHRSLLVLGAWTTNSRRRANQVGLAPAATGTQALRTIRKEGRCPRSRRT